MPAKKQQKTFEENLKDLETIVTQLENGDVPLDKALKQFKHGVQLSNRLQKKLTGAKKTLTKMMDASGQEVPYDRDKNGQDVNNSVNEGDSHA